jgi:hypothetical protein
VRQRLPVTTIESMKVRGSLQNFGGGVVPRLVKRTRKPGVRHTASENHVRFVQASGGAEHFRHAAQRRVAGDVELAEALHVRRRAQQERRENDGECTH